MQANSSFDKQVPKVLEVKAAKQGDPTRCAVLYAKDARLVGALRGLMMQGNSSFDKQIPKINRSIQWIPLRPEKHFETELQWLV